MDLESRRLRGPGRLVARALLSLLVIGFAGQAAPVQPAKPDKLAFAKNSPFYFDGTISRQTLENYLNHAITMGYFLVPGRPESYQFPYREDDVRMIHNLGAKFIGRAIYLNHIFTTPRGRPGTGASSECTAWRRTGERLVAKYVSSWNSLPTVPSSCWRI